MVVGVRVAKDFGGWKEKGGLMGFMGKGYETEII